MSQRKRGVPSQAVDLKRLLSRLGRNLFIAATLLTAFFATSAYAQEIEIYFVGVLVGSTGVLNDNMADWEEFNTSLGTDMLHETNDAPTNTVSKDFDRFPEPKPIRSREMVQ